MAKLSARGRTELVRVSKERTMPEFETCRACGGEGTYSVACVLDSGMVLHEAGETCKTCHGVCKDGVCVAHPTTVWEKRTRTLMSDRTVLEKLDVRFPPGPYDKGPVFHTYGWKVYGKAKPELTTPRFIVIYEKLGFTVER